MKKEEKFLKLMKRKQFIFQIMTECQKYRIWIIWSLPFVTWFKNLTGNFGGREMCISYDWFQDFCLHLFVCLVLFSYVLFVVLLCFFFFFVWSVFPEVPCFSSIFLLQYLREYCTPSSKSIFVLNFKIIDNFLQNDTSTFSNLLR